MDLLTKIKEKTLNQKLLKKPSRIIFLLLLIVIIVLAIFSKNNSSADSVTVTRGEITQTVSVTGNTKSEMTARLAFDRGGRIGKVNGKEGDRVTVGSIIVQLEAADLVADLREKEANLIAEKIKLEEILRGTREEELAISRTKVTNAENSLRQSQLALLSGAKDAYIKSDDAIRSRMDQMFLNPRINPTLLFYLGDSSLRMNLESGRAEIERVLNDWNESVQKLSNPENAVTLSSESANFLSKVTLLLEKAVLALNDARPDQNTSQASIDAWKATVSTGRINVSAARTSLQSASENLSSAEQLLELARRELYLDEAGSAKEVISTQKAVIAQTEARRDNAVALLEKTRIRAPFNGIITKQDAIPGEIAIIGAPLVSVISENNLEIETDIPEIDSVRVKPGDTVKVVFDALPDEAFYGTLAFVEPAETLDNGVAYYKATVHLSAQDTRLKSGLTANLDIAIMKKSDILIIPKYTVKTADGKYFVTRLNGKSMEEVPVTLGLEGGGMIEVSSGLEEGDLISFEISSL